MTILSLDGATTLAATGAGEHRTLIVSLFTVFVLGLAQFLTTFLIAWWYSRHAAARLDPKAEAIKSRLEGEA